MQREKKKVLVIAGEASGDYHAANLVAEMKKLDPALAFWGVGGAKMAAAGVELVREIKELSVLGVTDVLTKIRPIIGTFRLLKKELLTRGADVVVLVDYPGFNLRFAGMAKRRGFKVAYYITPKVWAWGAGRLQKMRRFLDKALVIFPFEEEILRQAGVPVTFVGNPLIDGIKQLPSREDARRLFALNPHDETIVLLPGSREGEIKRILPVMLEAAKMLGKNNGTRQFILPLADSIAAEDVAAMVGKSGVKVNIVKGNTHVAIQCADMAIATSGTVTLETAIIGVPLVIVYKTSPLTYIIAKNLAKTRFVGLPNIILGREVAKELLQGLATPTNIAAEIERISSQKENIAAVLAAVTERLGKGDAAKLAAAEVCRLLENR